MKAAFTVVTNNYISYAKTLGDSVRRHNPEYTFFICLIGKKTDLNSYVDLSDFSLIEINELNDTAIIGSMQSRYSVFELSCALKPYFAEHILKNKFINRLKYIDSDIMLFNSFDPIIESNVTSAVFLTPHFFCPVNPSEGNVTNDAVVLKSGIYNAGYFEVNNSESSFCFLDWWKERLFNWSYLYKYPFEQINADQSWLNLVPVYFKDVAIIDHLGYNASFYNLHEREISNANKTYLINKNTPLIFFHFTGYKYYQHEKVSIHNPKYNYENTPFLESICNEYRDALIENSIEIILNPGTIYAKPKASRWAFVEKIINHLLKRLFKIRVIKANI